MLLLLHSERRYLLGRAPFPDPSSWRELEDLLPRPDLLQAVSHVRYSWHSDSVFVGYDKVGGNSLMSVVKYQTQTGRMIS